MLAYIILLIDIRMVFSHPPNVETDSMIITYQKHADAIERDPEPTASTQPSITSPPTSETVSKKPREEREDVIFLPAEKYIPPADDAYISRERIREMYDKFEERNLFTAEPEKPDSDTLFVKGLNVENVEKVTKKTKIEQQGFSTNERGQLKMKIDCTNLNCNDTKLEVCGGKREHNKWKYRLFHNECFYRRVNCGLKFDINRYIKLGLENCYSTPSYYYRPYMHGQLWSQHPKIDESRRQLLSRRSESLTINGVQCGHNCPIQCPDTYDPECAQSVTNLAEKRVFVNHCELDLNSCINSVAWRRRPLSECVGVQMAEKRQNSGFITWLQRMGVLDSRGRMIS